MEAKWLPLWPSFHNNSSWWWKHAATWWFAAKALLVEGDACKNSKHLRLCKYRCNYSNQNDIIQENNIILRWLMEVLAYKKENTYILQSAQFKDHIKSRSLWRRTTTMRSIIHVSTVKNNKQHIDTDKTKRANKRSLVICMYVLLFSSN